MRVKRIENKVENIVSILEEECRNENADVIAAKDALINWALGNKDINPAARSETTGWLSLTLSRAGVPMEPGNPVSEYLWRLNFHVMGAYAYSEAKCMKRHNRDVERYKAHLIPVFQELGRSISHR